MFKIHKCKMSSGRCADPEDCAQIYVANFPFNFSERDVCALFVNYKPIRARIIRERARVYAFVTFSSKKDCFNVIEEYKNVMFGGTKLVLENVTERSRGSHKYSCSPRSVRSKSVDCHVRSRQCKDPPQEDPEDYSDMPELGEIPHDILLKIVAELEKEKQGQVDGKTLEPSKPKSILKIPTNNGEKAGNEVPDNQSESLSKVIACDFKLGTSEDDLMELFKCFCPIRCKMMSEEKMGQQDFTFAYVYLPNEKLAKLAEMRLCDTTFNGKVIYVKHVVVPANCG